MPSLKGGGGEANKQKNWTRSNVFVIPALGGRDIQDCLQISEFKAILMNLRLYLKNHNQRENISMWQFNLCGSLKYTLHAGDRARGQCVHLAYTRPQGLIPSSPLLVTDKQPHASYRRKSLSWLMVLG